MENIAKLSCQNAMLDERNTVVEAGGCEDCDGCVGIKCSFDMGWQKRGKGHNSSTGTIKNKIIWFTGDWYILLEIYAFPCLLINCFYYVYVFIIYVDDSYYYHH